MEYDYIRIEKAIAYLYQNTSSQPSLDEVADHVAMSPFHFQRVFTEWAGISPKKFLQLLTLEHLKKVLNESSDMQEAVFSAGLSSSSRAHDLFVNLEAVTPAEYKNLGKSLSIFYGFQVSPFGKCLIASTERGICHLSFLEEGKEGEALEELFANWPLSSFIENKEKSAELAKAVFGTYKSELRLFTKGTAFQIQVWRALLKIGEGRMKSYEDIANSVGNPKANRAVGTAVGSNSIAYLIPCHRVIRKTGVLGNYRWGADRKKMMLGFELSKYQLLNF